MAAMSVLYDVFRRQLTTSSSKSHSTNWVTLWKRIPIASAVIIGAGAYLIVGRQGERVIPDTLKDLCLSA